MNKLKKIFLVFLLALLIIPMSVFADGEEATSDDVSKEVAIYFFRGEGCPHCQEAEEWFESIEEEYGDKFTIVDYETWSNQNNADLMSKVAKARGEESTATGVPYIIIGDQSWIGFDEAYEAEILDKINELYEQEVNERYDIMSMLDSLLAEIEEKEKASMSDVIALIIILAACGGLGFGIYFARKETNK